MDVVDALAHRGRFFRVLQQTSRSQTAVMTIAPGDAAGPEEEHAGDQVIYVVEGEALVRIGDQERRAAARARDDSGGHTPPREEPRRAAALLRHDLRAARVLSDGRGRRLLPKE